MAIRADRVGVRQDQVDVHGRVTSPSFLNELLEDLPEWTDMPVWVNGTEELLPSNNSVPVTSPILADIAYPDIRRDNQYFTYRESPTPVDGLAKIKSIKGNTLVWNQLAQNGNFTAISPWSINSNGSMAVANNEASVTVTSVPSNTYSPNIRQATASGFVLNHKYLISFDVYLPHQSYMRIEFGGGGFGRNTDSQLSANTWHKVLMAITRDTAPTNNLLVFYPPYATGVWSANDVWKIRNINVFDLTLMGLENEEFASLFSLPYYDYNAGTLLSFNGTGLKTVGLNQWDEEWEVGGIGATGVPEAGNYVRSKNYIPVMANTEYCFTSPLWGVIYQYDINHNFLLRTPLIGGGSPLFTTLANTAYIKFFMQAGYGTDYKNDICLNISGNKNGSYAPYKESSATLPILTYFPTGMKSAGTVYDELLPTKAITRIGAVDLGTLNWYYTSGGQGRFATGSISSTVKHVTSNTEVANIKNAKYSAISAGLVYNGNTGIAIDNAGAIWVYDTTYGTDASAFRTAMSGVYLYYELATPVELPTMSFE